jgi:DNA-binding NarL/FixJ family response regulator
LIFYSFLPIPVIKSYILAMNILPFLSTSICIISLIMGIYVIRLDPKERLHQLFFLLIMTVALFNFFAIIVFSATDKDILIFWYRFSSITIFILPLTLHIISEVVKLKKIIKYPILLISYSLAIYFIYQEASLELTYKNFVRENGFWLFIKADMSFAYFLCTFSAIAIYLASFCLLINSYIKSKIKREKRQTLVFIFSLLLLIIFIFIQQIIWPLFSDKDLGLHPIFLSIWPFGIAFAIIKYRFLAISPERICKDIVENVEEAIMITNRNLNIIYANPKSKSLITDASKREISRIIFEYDSVKEKIQALLDGSLPGLTSNLNYVTKDNKKLLMSVRFSVIKDKFQDITGILLLAQEVKGIKEFMLKYKLTDREFEVVRLLVSGISNKTISAQLKVAESTIKTHIEHIYTKTEVKNKVELTNLLKEARLVL